MPRKLGNYRQCHCFILRYMCSADPASLQEQVSTVVNRRQSNLLSLHSYSLFLLSLKIHQSLPRASASEVQIFPIFVHRCLGWTLGSCNRKISMRVCPIEQNIFWRAQKPDQIFQRDAWFNQCAPKYTEQAVAFP